jgi:hypothetical protein
VGKCEGPNDRAKSNCGTAEIGSRKTEIEHRIPLFRLLDRPDRAFAALRCGDHYLATVSGRLRREPKMVSSGEELIHHGGRCGISKQQRPPEAAPAPESVPRSAQARLMVQILFTARNEFEMALQLLRMNVSCPWAQRRWGRRQLDPGWPSRRGMVETVSVR